MLYIDIIMLQKTIRTRNIFYGTSDIIRRTSNCYLPNAWYCCRQYLYGVLVTFRVNTINILLFGLWL